MPGLTEMLINTPDNIGNRDHISQLSRIAVHIAAYAVVLDFIAADCMLFIMLLRIRKGLVFTEQTVTLIRGVSWCCIGLCLIFGFLGIYFQLAFLVSLLAVFLGLCLRVCKNAIEDATRIKQENDLTV